MRNRSSVGGRSSDNLTRGGTVNEGDAAPPIREASYFSKGVFSAFANTFVSRSAVANDSAALLANEGGGSGAASPSTARDLKRGSLTVIPLLGLLFANCTGSGYGFEQAVGGAGPLVTLIACNILPWFWSLPTGLAVAELASAMPSNSGSLMWINAAYHPVISTVNMIASVAISCLCNASYASLCSQYTLNFIEPSVAVPERWKKDLVKMAAVVLCGALNIIGVEIVGVATVVTTVLTLTPFLGITIGSFIHYPVNWHAVAHIPSNINWPQFISIVTWNYSNIDSVGNAVEEVHQPQKTLPRAMVPLMFLTYPAYFLPVLAGISAAAAQPGYHTDLWVEGYWSTIAQYAGGKGLRDFLLFGAVLSGLGYLLTGLCYSGRQLAGMGEMDVFPERVSNFLAALSPRFGTPVRGILLHCVVAIVLTLALSFNSLVALTQVLYCLRLSLIYIAAIRMRYQHPTLKRPFRFPAKNTATFAACMVIALLVSICTSVFSAMQSTVVTGVSIGFLAASVILSALYVKFVRPHGYKGCVVYDPSTDDDEGDAAPPIEAAASSDAPTKPFGAGGGSSFTV